MLEARRIQAQTRVPHRDERAVRCTEENVQLQSDLEEREAKIRRLFDSNIIGIVIFDFEERLSVRAGKCEKEPGHWMCCHCLNSAGRNTIRRAV
jgi:hypothetical protein